MENNNNIVETQSAINPQRVSLMQNFQDMFNVHGKLIDDLASSLANMTCRVAIIFVDLDNVPRFFEQITPEMISQLQYEVFIICSANSWKSIPCESRGKIHFSLANGTKDAADAICIVAATKLDSLLITYNRKGDVPLIIVSEDQIFSQVADLLSYGGTAVPTVDKQQVSSGVTVLQSILAAQRAGPPSPNRQTEASRWEWWCGACSQTFDQERERYQHCRVTGHPIPSGTEDSTSRWWLCGTGCPVAFGQEAWRDQHCRDKAHRRRGREDSGSEWCFLCGECGGIFKQASHRDQHCRDTGHPIPRGRKVVDGRAQGAGAAAGAAPPARPADPASTKACPETTRSTTDVPLPEKETDCSASKRPAPAPTALAGPVPCGGSSGTGAPEGDCGGDEAAVPCGGGHSDRRGWGRHDQRAPPACAALRATSPARSPPVGPAAAPAWWVPELQPEMVARRVLPELEPGWGAGSPGEAWAWQTPDLDEGGDWLAAELRVLAAWWA